MSSSRIIRVGREKKDWAELAMDEDEGNPYMRTEKEFTHSYLLHHESRSPAYSHVAHIAAPFEKILPLRIARPTNPEIRKMKETSHHEKARKKALKMLKTIECKKRSTRVARLPLSQCLGWENNDQSVTRPEVLTCLALRGSGGL